MSAEHVKTLQRLHEHYNGQAKQLRADMEAGRKGDSYLDEYMRYRQEAEALWAAIGALESDMGKESARYRWLTKELLDWEESPGVNAYMIGDQTFYGPNKDAAIDAAILADAARDAQK